MGAVTKSKAENYRQKLAELEHEIEAQRSEREKAFQEIKTILGRGVSVTSEEVQVRAGAVAQIDKDAPLKQLQQEAVKEQLRAAEKAAEEAERRQAVERFNTLAKARHAANEKADKLIQQLLDLYDEQAERHSEQVGLIARAKMTFRSRSPKQIYEHVLTHAFRHIFTTARGRVNAESINDVDQFNVEIYTKSEEGDEKNAE